MANVIEPIVLLDQQTITQLLTFEECIAGVEAAFAAHAKGQALTPGLLHVEADGGEFHIKVGGLRGERVYFAAKIGGGFFNNSARYGLPNLIGLILLSDGRNGVPLAVMESGVITRLRTGAATAAAAKYLARSDSRVVTICGAGIQAEIQLRALKQVLPIQRAYVWSRSPCATFTAKMSQALDLDVRSVTELADATRVSDVIVTCTPAKRWLLGRDHVRPGTFIAAVGADSPDKQELEPQLLAEAVVVPDLLDQASHVGDLHHAVACGLMRPDDVRGELGDVIIGKAPGRMHEDEIIVFDSTGTALQDAAAAIVVYEKAVGSDLGHRFQLWRQE